jgi:hypothetical protein
MDTSARGGQGKSTRITAAANGTAVTVALLAVQLVTSGCNMACSTSGGAGAYYWGSILHDARPWLKLRTCSAVKKKEEKMDDLGLDPCYTDRGSSIGRQALSFISADILECEEGNGLPGTRSMRCHK